MVNATENQHFNFQFFVWKTNEDRFERIEELFLEIKANKFVSL